MSEQRDILCWLNQSWSKYLINYYTSPFRKIYNTDQNFNLLVFVYKCHIVFSRIIYTIKHQMHNTTKDYVNTSHILAPDCILLIDWMSFQKCCLKRLSVKLETTLFDDLSTDFQHIDWYYLVAIASAHIHRLNNEIFVDNLYNFRTIISILRLKRS